jgi:hypothetical protein
MPEMTFKNFTCYNELIELEKGHYTVAGFPFATKFDREQSRRSLNL